MVEGQERGRKEVKEEEREILSSSVEREWKAVVIDYQYGALSVHEDNNPDMDPILRNEVLTPT